MYVEIKMEGSREHMLENHKTWDHTSDFEDVIRNGNGASLLLRI
jgi:hypothetical protein